MTIGIEVVLGVLAVVWLAAGFAGGRTEWLKRRTLRDSDA